MTDKIYIIGISILIIVFLIGTIMLVIKNKSKTIQPQTNQPQTNQPQTIQPQTIQPQTIQPQTNQPQTIQPQTIQPQTNQPQTTQPQTIQPLEKCNSNGKYISLPGQSGFCQCDKGYFGDCKYTNEMCTKSGGKIYGNFAKNCLCSNNKIMNQPPFCKS